MWIQLKAGTDHKAIKHELSDMGRVEDDPHDSSRFIITFLNQSESGMRMVGFRLSQDFIQEFEDFGMMPE